jgi:predicted aspartyl protease
MGTFRIEIGVENPAHRGRVARVPEVLVDTGSEFTWLPAPLLIDLGIPVERTQRFRVADGRILERDMGYAIVHAGGTAAVEHVVFGNPDDLVLIGAHCLEGLNLRVDPQRKQLVDAGPIVTAAA